MFIVIVILTIGQTFSENLYFQKRYENMTETGLTKADGDTLMSWLYFNEDGKMEADDQLKQAVEKRDGWLQVIDSKNATSIAINSLKTFQHPIKRMK